MISYNQTPAATASVNLSIHLKQQSTLTLAHEHDFLAFHNEIQN